MTVAPTAIRIEAASDRGIGTFIRVPWPIYTDDQHWIPPLLLERRDHLSKRNPFFAHAAAQFWVAYRGDQAVGRISAQIDRLHIERYNDATGFFGMLEAIDDQAVFAALLGTAEHWLRERGMKRVIGPFNLSINEEMGLLVEGFDTPPMFMMGHARPYYQSQVLAHGYVKAKDVVAYVIDPKVEPPSVMRAERRQGGGSIRVRPLRLKQLAEDLEIIRDIHNDAWSENWGFVPFTMAELATLGSSLKLFIPPDFVHIAEVDGQPVAMLVALPNVNEAIRDLDGRLLPFGWARLAWRLKRDLPHSARVALMGLRKQFHRSALGMAVVLQLLAAVRRATFARGVHTLELSWILENNRPMRRILEGVGAHVYKTYRIYEKPLV